MSFEVFSRISTVEYTLNPIDHKDVSFICVAPVQPNFILDKKLGFGNSYLCMMYCFRRNNGDQVSCGNYICHFLPCYVFLYYNFTYAVWGRNKAQKCRISCFLKLSLYSKFSYTNQKPFSPVNEFCATTINLRCSMKAVLKVEKQGKTMNLESHLQPLLAKPMGR